MFKGLKVRKKPGKQGTVRKQWFVSGWFVDCRLQIMDCGLWIVDCGWIGTVEVWMFVDFKVCVWMCGCVGNSMKIFLGDLQFKYTAMQMQIPSNQYNNG